MMSATNELSNVELDRCFIEEFAVERGDAGWCVCTPLSVSPHCCGGGVTIECVMVTTSVSVMFKVPTSLLFADSWIGVFDRYETNNTLWTRRVPTLGRKNAYRPL